MKKITVDNFEIGGNQTYIIADVGSNHMQDINLAKESIDAVKESGANAVKFQSIQTDKLYLNPSQETRDFVNKLEFPEHWHQELSEYAKKKGITFFSSPTYMDSVDILESIDVSIYKLASAQIGTFPQIVEKVARLQKPTIFSTGISSFENTKKAVELFERVGNQNYIILHCNSIYPTPTNRVNLGLMEKYQTEFDCPVGFSDHTVGINVAIGAVARGAKVIEKHFTVDRNFPAPDSNEFASDFNELKDLVQGIRQVEQAVLGNSERTNLEPEEQEFKSAIAYRMVAKRDIDKGEILNELDFDFIRANSGMDCVDFYNLNKPIHSSKSISKGSILLKEDLEK